jgi:aspartate/methionine/tyrosine aminotransferase
MGGAWKRLTLGARRWVQVVLFRPYYFSHLVAIELLGLTPLLVDCDETGLPDADALREALRRPTSRVRAVTLVSPSNPSGVVCPQARALEVLEASRDAGAWLISDEAYEHFVYDGAAHESPASASTSAELADGVVSLYTFSKSYGLAGWRVGYLSYPRCLHEPLLKVQDTLPTHPTNHAQDVALLAMSQLGDGWVRQQVASLTAAREQLWAALEPAMSTGPGQGMLARPQGAYYYLLPLPPGVSEVQAIERLASRHQLLLLPGSAFGLPGCLRLSYGCLGDDAIVQRVVAHLRDALEDLWPCCA